MFASPELINHMNKVKDSYNVNSMTQVAGEAALRDREDWNWLVSSTIAERTWLLESCAKFDWTYPKTDVRSHLLLALAAAPGLTRYHTQCPQANFVLFDVGSAARADYLYSGLKNQGLLVRYWGSRPDLCTKLRVTVGTRESNERFVNLVTDLLAAEGSKKQKK